MTGNHLADDPPPGTALASSEPVALVDLLDRVLARGVVVTGEVTISIAEVDLIHLSLRALLCSARPGLFGDPEPAHNRASAG